MLMSVLHPYVKMCLKASESVTTATLNIPDIFDLEEKEKHESVVGAYFDHYDEEVDDKNYTYVQACVFGTKAGVKKR